MTMASATSLPARASAASSALTQVLQSDPVRRLFNQPNIVIHAIPRTDSPTAFRMVKPKSCPEKKNGINGDIKISDKPEVSIQVINSLNQEVNDTENLLPSKRNGKSEILLVPIIRKRKECGHFEPCESLVCEVNVQQHEDDDGITPLISLNISEDEIDALVAKHCENDKCDALSIDHDLCRRASIQLHRCDKSTECDTPETKLQSCKDHLNHKKCKRKVNYLYNIATPTEIFKLRMRERELQILEATRKKRSNDYLDPIMGFTYTMNALRKNDELIIVPKIPPADYKPPKLHYGPLNNNISCTNKNSSIKSILGSKRLHRAEPGDKELTSEMISNIILSCQNSINMSKNNSICNSTPTKQIKLSDHLNGAIINIRESPSIPSQECINVSRLPPPLQQLQPKGLTDSPLISRKSVTPQDQQQINHTGLQSNVTKMTEILNMNGATLVEKQTYKVVPIAELKSEPSLLHQAQGVPKFCVVPDKSTFLKVFPKPRKSTKNKKFDQKKRKLVPPLKLKKILPKIAQIFNPEKFRPIQPAIVACNAEVKLPRALLPKKQKIRKKQRKKMLKKGKFKCTYCPKRYLTQESCKQHIANHENDPGFFCRLCEKGFVGKHLIKKHIDVDHKAGEVRCEMCSHILPSMQDLLKHMVNPDDKFEQQCSECSENFDTCGSLDYHLRKQHGFLICTVCKRQIAKSKMKKHLMLEHSFSKNRTETGFEKLTCLPGENDEVNEISLIIDKPIVEPETIVKTEPEIERKIEADCLAKGRSARRSSKEFFACAVCERRFNNEKQYDIHMANNPMKFTQCPNCKKKFHRKAEYTEHSKTCLSLGECHKAIRPSKRRQNNHAIIEAPISKIDKKQNAILDSDKSKKLKLDEEKIVTSKDADGANISKNTVETESILKNSVETEIVNGVNQNPSDYLEYLKIKKIDRTVPKKEESEIVKIDDKKDLLLDHKQVNINTSETTTFDKIILTNINQDHNYQVLK